jgi:WD repeat-containing protein 68
MCTVGDDCKAYIWDLTAGAARSEYQTPLLEYKADDQISNLSWSNLQKEWLAISYVNQLQILRL